MKNFKRYLRLTAYAILIILAAMAMGIAIPFNTREKFMENEIKTEMYEKRDDEGEEDMDKSLT
ncbi:MAG: hypothetical protein AAFX87_28130 [Bacteroidota bacterium]